jgi:hypothetical protein
MQRAKTAKPNKMQSQRAAPRKQSQKSPKPSFTLMGPKAKLSFKGLPATVEVTQNQPTWLRMEGKVSHPELGGGVRVAGRQLLCSVATTAGDNQLFSANGATVVSVNSIQLTPDTLNGRLALQARTYDRYAFRKLKITYVPRVPTSQAGSFAVGYVSDSELPTVSFATTSSMVPAMTTTFYGEPRSLILVDDMSSNKTWFTLLDSTSTSSRRQTIQGTLVGFPDITSIGAITMGTIWIDYLIDLYQPTADQAFTFRLTDEESEYLLKKRAIGNGVSKTSESISEEIGSLQLRIQQLKSGNINLV